VDGFAPRPRNSLTYNSRDSINDRPRIGPGAIDHPRPRSGLIEAERHQLRGDFVWDVSTSSYQIEAAENTDGGERTARRRYRPVA
jgi:Glycosyl hydrolase family 1